MRKKLLGVLAVVMFWAGVAQSQPVTWWTAHALVKVRPGDPAPLASQKAVSLYAARNEFEPFQVLLRSEAGDVEGVDAELTDLTTADRAVLSKERATVYLERYLNLKVVSSIEGAPGEWPDPLVPRVDRYARERRNAFPFTLRRGRTQPLWIELYVPLETPPGDYSGSLRVSAKGKELFAVPIHLKVWNFTLPSTSSLPNSFGFNGVTALKQHKGHYTNDDDLYQITALYAKAALLHRLSFHGGSLAPPPFALEGSKMEVRWTSYDNEVGPLLDGNVLGKGDPLPGAKATSVDLRTHGSADTNEKKILYWREWVKHFTRRGWADRLFYYAWDEPQPSNYPQVVSNGRLTHEADPQLRNLVTVALHPALAGVVDIWTPLINCFQTKPGFEPFCDHQASRDAYRSPGEKGKRLWWYQSCGSHGCGGPGGEYFRGWPSYVIDVGAVSNRIMEWLTWKYQIQGELYFSVNEAFARDLDPWQDVYMHGGNGDGTLFYPGRTDKIGGHTDIPIESIRLKLIREGMEDYEYLALLSRWKSESVAAQAVQKTVQTPYQWEHNPEALYATRRQMGETLDQLSRSRGTLKAAGVPARAGRVAK